MATVIGSEMENNTGIGLRNTANESESTEFIQFLSDYQRHISREQVRLSKFLEMSTKLHRRYRAITISDLVSGWGRHPATQGQWIEYDPNEDGEVHPINIVQPAIRANVNACLQAQPQIEISSTNQSADARRAADRWRQVNDFLYRRNWREDRRAMVFDALQKDGTILIHSYPQRNGRMRVETQGLFSCPNCGATGAREQIDYRNLSGQGQSTVDAAGNGAVGDSTNRDVAASQSGQSTKTELRSGDFAQHGDQNLYVPLGQAIENGTAQPPRPESPISDEGLAEEFHQIQCPECGFDAATAFIGEIETPEYDIKTEILPLFHFTIDRLGAKLDGIQGAHWVQIQQPVHRSQLESEYPHMSFGGPFPWSRHIQLDYALSSADWRYFNYSEQHYSTVRRFDVFEKRRIYIHEDSYREWRSANDFEFRGKDGEIRFDIKTGERISEAYMRRFGFNPEGMLTVWIYDQLIDIVPPTETEVNLRQCISEVHWLRDSGSFISSPYYSIVQIQDDITLLNTQYHNIIARNSVNQVYYDSLVFDQNDFSKEYVGTKNAHLLPDRSIDKAITQLPIPQPSAHLINHLQFLFQIKDTITMATPALKGEAQRGETYAAQRQQLEQSMGLLTSALKSWANALVMTFRQQSRLTALWWTKEQFEAVASEFGEKWTQADIDEMVNIDFDRDLVVSYTQGTEMPRSQIQREMQFFNGLQQLFALGPDMVLNILGPDKIAQLLKRIDEFSQFDFDLTGLEVQDLVNQRRYIDLTRVAADYASLPLEQIEAMKLNVKSIKPDGLPISEFDILIEQLLGQTLIRFDEFDDLESVAKFFVERLRIENSAVRPNYVLIELLRTVIKVIEIDVQNRQLEASQQAVLMQQADPATQFAREREVEAGLTQAALSAAGDAMAEQQRQGATTA